MSRGVTVNLGGDFFTKKKVLSDGSVNKVMSVSGRRPFLGAWEKDMKAPTPQRENMWGVRG